MLLVLLPLGTNAAEAAALDTLRRQLGTAVRVLAIDEANHPAVVRTFREPTLPACVLVRQGVELWRQPGLPEAATVAGWLATLRAPGETLAAE